MTESATRTAVAGPRAAAPARDVAELPLHVVEPCRPGVVNAWRDAWRYRRMLAFFGQRFLRKRTARTWLGTLWIPLRPTVNLVARILVFGGLIGIATGDTPYPLYFVVATALWQLFSETLTWGVRSLELNRKMLADIYVPRLLVVVSALIPSLLEFAVYVVFAIFGLAYYFVRADVLYLNLDAFTLLAPAGLVLMALLGVGLGLFLAAAGARARDLRFALGYGLGFLYFMTPVIYPLSAVPNQWRPVAELNPLTGAMEMVKRGLFRSETFSTDAVWVTLVAVVLLWGPGLWLMRRRELALLNGGRSRSDATASTTSPA